MSDSSQPSEQEELFIRTFGISPQELREKGIDPGRYAAEHMRSALRDPEKASRLLPKSSLLIAESRRWSARTYYCLFLTIAALLVLAVKLAPLARFAVVLVSVVILAIGAWCYSKGRGIYKSYKNECRVEGIEIKDMWGRQVNRQLQRLSPDFSRVDREFNRMRRSRGES